MDKKEYTKILKHYKKRDQEVQLLNMQEIDKAVIALIKSKPSLKEWNSLMPGIVLSAKGLWYIMNYNLK